MKNLQKVESTNIDKIGFEKDVEIFIGRQPVNVLRVVFTNGRVYDYYGVDEVLYQNFLEAKSIGSFFHKFINKQYEYERIN